ncbi:flagellar protein FlgJ [Stakelama sediminis]|uniref:Flagellar protein FlgJ n=1 Tax=Stakelama sediminis TaxID=463200 RepID=A0A840YWI0_9SPHN|nr:flagellar protein FlgJ [Stakelama sediminis]
MTSTNAVASSPSGVSQDTSRLATAANLKKAGQKFEAIFVNMMLKSMRQAKLADSLFDDKATQQFRDMQDQQLAQNMAATTPLGIGKAMTDFLAKGNPTLLDPTTTVDPQTQAEAKTK